MHTAEQLQAWMFDVEVEGRAASIGDLFPDWSADDRFGIVLDEPYGALGASLLLQAAITHFFDFRRAHGIALDYPEIYAVHVGRWHGDHSFFDFWPPHKEFCVEADLPAVVEAVHDSGITRLAVPDRDLSVAAALPPAAHVATGQVVTAWAYSPSGQAREADVVIRSQATPTEENPARTLDPLYAERRYGDSDDPAVQDWLRRIADRFDEVDPATRARIAERRRRTASTNGAGSPDEAFRRIPVDEALRLAVWRGSEVAV